MDSSRPITQAEIGNLVEVFYSRARSDEILGPIFEQVVDNWPKHMALLKDFWSTVLLTSASYRGNPLARHLALPIDEEHFDRWLSLFSVSAHEVFSAAHAEQVILKSRQIAKSFQVAIAAKR